MPKMSIVLWGGAPWGFRLQGGGHNALVISRVTSNGKASGAGVRVGSKVTSINGTPTSSLTLSAAHALTKQGSALTLELETEPSTPYPSISSVSSSASSCATVIPARTPISNHNIEKTHSNSKNETNLSSKESDPEESKNKRDSFADDDDSENRNSIDLASLLSTENSQNLRGDRRINSDYTTLSESSTSDGYRQTLTEGEELNLTDISAPPSETSESTAVESEYDYGSLNSERNSYKDNNEESYNISDVNYERDEIYPDLHAENRHPLVESGYDCNNDPLVDNIRYYSTILEESEEDESAAHSSEAFGLKLNMGQHFSSNSGGADRNNKKKKQNIDKIDECRNSSHASSEGWRLSQTSTNSNVSSSTGGGDSDDTLGQNMSELSSINSHLSRLGRTSEDFKSLDRNEVNYYVQDIKKAKNDPDATPVATPVAVKKNNTIIKNAIDELEIIEQAAQHLLQQSQSSPGRSSSRRLLNPNLLQPKVVEEKDFIKREINTKKHVDQSTNLIEKYIYNNDGTYTVNGIKINAQKTENKLKLNPADDRGSVPTTEVKRRQWTKCTQLQPYISRESYNEDDFIKEIESLRGSYRESDLNDFLDKLESSGVKNSLDEDQYEQLIADIKADAERPNSIRGSKESLQIETKDKKLIKSSQESLTKAKSSTMKKFERLKERILVLIRGKSRNKGRQKNDTLNSSNFSSETNGISKHDVINTSQPISNVSEATDSNKTLEVKAKKTSIEPTKIEEKKGFKITQFLKMGSPRLSRKENGAKADKQDISVSDTEIDDHDTKNKDTKKILRKSNGSLPNISENKTSPTGSQELKKEVRFNLKFEEVSNGYEKPVMKICEPSNSSQIVKELCQVVNETGSQVPKIPTPTASQKDLKEHKSEIPLPATVAEINKMNKLRENANTRAEHLLPKLPERIKPPRRMKKKNLIPATVESISLESFESLSQKSSDDSSAASPKNSIIFEKENILEKTQEYVLSSQEEFKPLDPTEHYQDILDINKFKTHEVQNEQINSKFDSEELLITETESPADAVDNTKEKRNLLKENEINKFNKDEKLFKQEVKEEVSERSDHHLMKVQTEATNKITPNVILPYIEPANSTINPEDTIENDIICETEKPVSHFKKDTTPGFPESEETMASFYDNMNPYYEAMTKLEEEVEDVASYYETQHNQNKDEIILDSKVKDKIKLFEREDTVKGYDVNVLGKENNILSSMEKTFSEHAKSLLNNDTSTKNLINITNVCESIDGDISKNSRQEALSSLENENKAYCIDDLNILTEEIARLANDMERDMKLQIESANLENDNVINNTAQNRHGQQYKTNDLFRKEMATMSTQTEVTLRKTVRKPEIVSQTDTEFEETDLDFETESEVEYANSSRTKPKQTNPYFGPSTSYTKTETLVSSIGRSSETTPTPKKQPPVVPPRQFQQKMPLNVVRELKYFLSDNGEESRLKKPELPPRWDSILTVNNELQQLELAESNLLNEIEQVLGFGIRLTEDGRVRKGSAKAKVTGKGTNRYPNADTRTDYESKLREVWSPGGEREERSSDGPSKIEVSDLPSFKDVPPIWTPARAGSASPSFGRKEYKKLHFEGTTLPRKSSQENVSSAPRPEESFAWKDREAERLKSTLPRVQSPTVTLLQKKRDDGAMQTEGQIPGPRPDYMHQDEAYYKPGDKLYTIKREYESEDEEVGSRKFAVLGPRKIEGVGPTTRDGVPVTLKSGVKSEHQGEWYRRMFDSLHKVRDDPLSNYRSKARYGGYMSEPDGYDSDIGSSRYISLDRRNKKFEVDVSDTNPKNTKRYVHQPGRIENYIPGFSSLSEKELRDIKTKEAAPVPTTQRFGSSRMQMSNALKDTGYESDSTLVFRKREDHRRRYLDPKHSSQAYRQVQQGGDIPLTGLQKPAPARPRDSPYKYNSSEVNIHYRTPVRVEHKESLSEEELARRQEEHMKKVYEQERRKKYLAELEDIERRRHTDNFTPLQKSPIPLNRYDDETFGGPIGAKTPEPKQVARALFNFSAQNKRELSFNKGDIVTIRRAIDRNWYEGEVRGVVGIFPCNYVEVIPFDSLKTLGRKPTEGQARTRFNFQAQTAMEMSLTKGEMVILTRRVDENWYEGRVGNRRGIFPVTYVDVLAEPGGDRPISPNRDPIPRPALPAAHLLYNGTSGVSSPYSTTGRSVNQSETKAFTQLTVNTQQDSVPYRALYNYKPQNEDELELIEGDIVLVMEKCDDGWFVGTSKRTGLFGTFPGNYVERC